MKINDKINKKEIKPKQLKSDFQNHYLKNYDVGLVTLAINREVLVSRKLKFNPNFNIIGDFDIVMKIVNNSNVTIIEKPLAIYRVHNESFTSKNFNMMAKELTYWHNENSYINKLSNYDKFLQKIVFYDAIGELKKKNLYNFFYKIKKVFFTVYFFKGMYLFLKTFISR